jgi:predicted secreted Zn-dependent protease
MIASLIPLAMAAVLTLQTPAPDAAAQAASPRLIAAAGLADLPDLILLGYEVEGRSPRSIRASINARRPPEDAGGARHDARTRWTYRNRVETGPDGQCDPRTATVVLRLTVVLPDLVSRDQLSVRERDGWDRYFAAVVAHERNHARIAVAGRDMLQTAMRASPTCDAMRAAVRTTAAGITAASQTYDRQTGHGRREGAVYPPPGA